MAAERAHKTPGCPLGARDSWPAALTRAEGDICQAGTETKVAKPAASPRCSAHTTGRGAHGSGFLFFREDRLQ